MLSPQLHYSIVGHRNGDEVPFPPLGEHSMIGMHSLDDLLAIFRS